MAYGFRFCFLGAWDVVHSGLAKFEGPLDLVVGWAGLAIVLAQCIGFCAWRKITFRVSNQNWMEECNNNYDLNQGARAAPKIQNHESNSIMLLSS